MQILARTANLFRRYAAAHLVLSRPGPALCDEGGQIVGQIDRFGVRAGRLFAEGWTAATVVRLSHGGLGDARTPALPRPDVTRAHPGTAGRNPGFSADLPFVAGAPATVSLTLADLRLVCPLPLPPAAALRRARLRLLPRFLRDLARAAPALLRWTITRSAAERARVKSHLRLCDPAPPRTLQDLLFLDDSLAALPDRARAAERRRLARGADAPRPVTILMPVHNAFHVLPEALDRVARHTDLPWSLILIEDASTDPAVRPFLRNWASKVNADRPGRVTLVENAQNLGFVRSGNLALKQALSLGHDVILLNSDALVPEGWASRLMRPFRHHRDVATVTPMSNEAEILSVPAISAGACLRPGEADRLDALARTIHPDAGLADIPTGIGFCMAIGITWLRRLPTFDEAFGRGYGEEVDWCRRIRALGGRHLATGQVFVEHRGATSFGATERDRRVEAGNALIRRRHPGFDAEVQDFLRDDPLASSRLALGIALAAARVSGRMPVYLAHSLGGGAEDYLVARIATDIGPDGPGAAIVLRVGGPVRWQVELHMRQGVTRGATRSFSFVERLLEPIRSRAVVYSCAVGDQDPSEIPGRLLALCRDGDTLEVLVHDYLPVSPSYTLLDADGCHSGLPDPKAPDRAHRHVRADGRIVTLADWQAKWASLIEAAATVTVFSRDSRLVFLGAFPGASKKTQLVPHRPLGFVGTARLRPGNRPVIGVLGSIGVQKGAAVVSALGRQLAATNRAGLVLIGTLDPVFTLPASATLHGAYRREEIASLASRYGIDRWLIPSIWPETFSYTTHEALATGLPVWCFDLGAQAEAVREAICRGAPGGVIALPEGRPDLSLLIQAILDEPALPAAHLKVPA